MQITDDHVEWAVVNRLQKMLEAMPHPEFNVTHTYALFVPILCWTVQRVRTDEYASEADFAAKSMLVRLKKSKVEEPPWSIPTDRFEKFKNMAVADFLITLRNAVAHGDARRVRPIHRGLESNRELVGFAFDCNEGTICLFENDMRRVGIGLAEQFCNSLRRSDKHRHDSYFGADANNCVVEKAA